MTRETADRALEPFFSTKDTGHGVGLGLASAWGIINRYSGGIFIDSQPGDGTRVTIHLPKSEAKPESTFDTIQQTRETTGNVLLVEDDDRIRRVAINALSRAGFSLRDASSGEYSSVELGDWDNMSGHWRYLAKPFLASELLEEARELMAEAS